MGKIYFLLVRIKIKHMEIAIIKRETTGIGQNTFNENETIAKYEIMDGAPVRGESIPIRLFLAGYELTPTMKDISKKFSVRYYLNLVLVDEEERRYFKQQEIVLWRKGDRIRKPIQQTIIHQQMVTPPAMPQLIPQSLPQMEPENRKEDDRNQEEDQKPLVVEKMSKEDESSQNSAKQTPVFQGESDD